MNSLKFYSELAHQILNSETQYLANKQIISDLFKQETEEDFESIVKSRITIIDSYYSTQMSKRLYGIDEIAKTLAEYSDEKLKLEATKFLNDPAVDSIIQSLFKSEYGIDKSGKPAGKSISLISKYLYFLNDFQFPIYDSLAIGSYKLLKKNGLLTTKIAIKEENYFTYLNRLNSGSNINNYEKLDNLLWLIGKLSKGSFGILMDKEKYLKLVNTSDIKDDFKKEANKKSSSKDEVIRGYIKKHYKVPKLFSEDQVAFFDFVFELERT